MHSFAWWPTLIVLGIATVTDLRSRWIPNWLVLPFLVSGIGVCGWLQGWHGVGQSFAGLGLGAAVFGILFWLGGMGAGDVKLCAALGAWLGPGQMFLALILTGIAGGVMALGWVIWARLPKRFFAGAARPVLHDKATEDAGLAATDVLGRKMPYAPAIAVGTLLSFFAR